MTFVKASMSIELFILNIIAKEKVQITLDLMVFVILTYIVWGLDLQAEKMKFL